jgi:diguanylate cyclase (GGDEF)-like protein
MGRREKRQERGGRPQVVPARPRGATERRVADLDKPNVQKARQPGRARAALLAAEVGRLERELAAAHTEIAALAARADVDPLTELLNRRGFERELARACAYVKRYGASAALIYLDLDGFKGVNDRYGHAAGDAMLKAVARVLVRHVRASDVVARLGGDEFALLLWNCGDAAAEAKALVIEQTIARTTAPHGDALLSVGASAGVAVLLPLDQPARVIERADRAMYARKELRRGRAAK